MWVLVLVCIFLPLKMLFGVSSGVNAEEYGDARLDRCRASMPVPGPLQTVQGAEFWGAILALQAFWPGHMSIDNLDVVRSSARLLDRGSLSKPLPLVQDGDLLAAVRHMIQVGLPKSRVMPLRLMLNRVGSGWRINLVMLRLTLLLT